MFSEKIPIKGSAKHIVYRDGRYIYDSLPEFTFYVKCLIPYAYYPLDRVSSDPALFKSLAQIVYGAIADRSDYSKPTECGWIVKEESNAETLGKMIAFVSGGSHVIKWLSPAGYYVYVVVSLGSAEYKR